MGTAINPTEFNPLMVSSRSVVILGNLKLLESKLPLANKLFHYRNSLLMSLEKLPDNDPAKVTSPLVPRGGFC
jgi:hypothetical protein